MFHQLLGKILIVQKLFMLLQPFPSPIMQYLPHFLPVCCIHYSGCVVHAVSWIFGEMLEIVQEEIYMGIPKNLKYELWGFLTLPNTDSVSLYVQYKAPEMFPTILEILELNICGGFFREVGMRRWTHQVRQTPCFNITGRDNRVFCLLEYILH